MAAKTFCTAIKKLAVCEVNQGTLYARTKTFGMPYYQYTFKPFLDLHSASVLSSTLGMNGSLTECGNSGTKKGPPKYVSSKERRIENIFNTFESLKPHISIEKRAKNCSNDLEVDTEILKETSSMAYRILPRMKPLIQEALLHKPNLIAGEEETKNTIGVIKVLHGNMGLGIKAIVRFLSRKPELFEVNEVDLKKRIENLRALKFHDVTLQRAVSRTPEYLLVPETNINIMASFLIGELDFTVKELPELFLLAPQVFLDPHEETEEKFQYIYFNMGHKQHNVLVRHGVMRHSLSHIRNRHLFLERRGQYQLPDKMQTVTIQNPQIWKIICTSDKYFCREVALCKLNELRLFRKVLKVEDEIRERDSNPEEPPPSNDLADKLLREMSQ